MKKQPKIYVFYLGIAIFAGGMLLKFLFPAAKGAMLSLPFVLTGFGSGIIGVGVVNILRKRRIENNPAKAREYEIAEKDERNIRLREKAGYAAWHITIVVLAILPLAFLVMDNFVACWFALGALFIHIASLFTFIFIYNKKL